MKADEARNLNQKYQESIKKKINKLINEIDFMPLYAAIAERANEGYTSLYDYHCHVAGDTIDIRLATTKHLVDIGYKLGNIGYKLGRGIVVYISWTKDEKES